MLMVDIIDDNGLFGIVIYSWVLDGVVIEGVVFNLFEFVEVYEGIVIMVMVLYVDDSGFDELIIFEFIEVIVLVLVDNEIGLFDDLIIGELIVGVMFIVFIFVDVNGVLGEISY